MNRQEVITFLSTHKQEFHLQYGVNKIGLFGSYARDTYTENSDVDILIELDPGTQDIYHKKSRLRQTLEEVFNTKVDIAREKYLTPLAREEVYKDVCFV